MFPSGLFFRLRYCQTRGVTLALCVPGKIPASSVHCSPIVCFVAVSLFRGIVTFDACAASPVYKGFGF